MQYARAGRLATVFAWLLIILFAFLISGIARADVNLPPTCSAADAEGNPGCGVPHWMYERPQGRLVRSGGIWRQFDSLPNTALVEVCPEDRPVGSDAEVAPLCTLITVPKSTLIQAPTPAPAPPPTSVLKNPVTFSWSVVPDAKGYLLRHSATINGVYESVKFDAPPVVSTGCPSQLGLQCHLYQASLPIGTRTVTMRSFNDDGESGDTPAISFAVSAPRPVPAPPAIVTATLPAFESVKSNNLATWRAVGTVPAGAAYLPFSAIASDGTQKCGVDRAKLVLAVGVKTRPTQVYVAC